MAEWELTIEPHPTIKTEDFQPCQTLFWVLRMDGRSTAAGTTDSGPMGVIERAANIADRTTEAL